MCLVATMTEANLVEGDANWWLDTGAMRHVCNNRNMFLTYEPTGNEINLFTGNSSSSNVVGKGPVELTTLSAKSKYPMPI